MYAIRSYYVLAGCIDGLGAAALHQGEQQEDGKELCRRLHNTNPLNHDTGIVHPPIFLLLLRYSNSATSKGTDVSYNFV